MTNNSVCFHNGDCKMIFCNGSFLFHTKNFAYKKFKYPYKHDDCKLHCSNIVNPDGTSCVLTYVLLLRACT